MLFKKSKQIPCKWATFVIEFVAKNFEISPNQIALLPLVPSVFLKLAVKILTNSFVKGTSKLNE